MTNVLLCELESLDYIDPMDDTKPIGFNSLLAQRARIFNNLEIRIYYSGQWKLRHVLPQDRHSI